MYIGWAGNVNDTSFLTDNTLQTYTVAYLGIYSQYYRPQCNCKPLTLGGIPAHASSVEELIDTTSYNQTTHAVHTLFTPRDPRYRLTNGCSKYPHNRPPVDNNMNPKLEEIYYSHTSTVCYLCIWPTHAPALLLYLALPNKAL